MADESTQKPLVAAEVEAPLPEEEPPLASVEIPPTVGKEEEHHAVVAVVEKEAPLAAVSPPPELSAAPVAEEHVSVTVPAEKEVPTAAVAAEAVVQEEGAAESGKSKKAPESFGSFKEESNVVADLSDSERKALEEFKSLVQEAIKNHIFNSTQAPKTTEEPSETKTQSSEISNLPQEVSIWGIPLLKDDRSDVILLKFLRARDFKVKESFAMLKNTIRWRKEFNIDELVDEELGDHLEKVVFMHGHDKEGHPVCYNVYGEFQNKELYNKTFADEEKRSRFLRWRIQFLEKSIRKLDFNPGGTNTIFQVSDLKNSPGPGKRELRIATKQALHLLQDNYPEFVAKQVSFLYTYKNCMLMADGELQNC